MRTKPEDRPVAPPATDAASSTRTRTPRRARWNARLAPWTPAPTTMTSDVSTTRRRASPAAEARGLSSALARTGVSANRLSVRPTASVADGLVPDGLGRDAQIGDEDLHLRFTVGVGGRSQDRRWMQRRQHLLALGQRRLHDSAMVPGDAERRAQDRLRGGGAEENDELGPDDAQLGFEPGVAGAHFGRVGAF